MGSQDASESDFVNGTIEKKGYRKRWTRRVKLVPFHPFNNGIHMDTHHLISAEAVKQTRLGDTLVSKGYDINDLSNLVGFPATLPGACQLKTQLHRGDHTHKRPGEKPYHKDVAGKIEELKLSIEKCYGRTKKKEGSSEVHEILDPIGKLILKKINRFQLPLTDIYKNFSPLSSVGCANSHDVLPAKASISSCENHRDHSVSDLNDGVDFRYQNSSANGNKKIITYSGSWTPKVGL